MCVCVCVCLRVCVYEINNITLYTLVHHISYMIIKNVDVI